MATSCWTWFFEVDEPPGTLVELFACGDHLRRFGREVVKRDE